MKRRRVSTIRLAPALALLGLAIVLGACATNNAPPADSVTSVTINEGSTTLVVGDTYDLTVLVDAKGGADDSVTWSSSADTVATVAGTGTKAATVTAVAAGTATITATSDFDGTKKDTVTITVVAPNTPTVVSVTIDQGDQSLKVGDTVGLTVTVDVLAGASTAVTWSSSNDTIATVSATGTVTAAALGTATITATSDFDGTKSDSVTVTVVPPNVDPNNIYVDASAAAGGNGTQAAPFQTIAAGVAAVNSGGTVHVAAGTYAESLYLEKVLTLSGADRNTVIVEVDGDAVGTSSSAGWVVHNVSGVTLENFTLRATAPGPTSYILAAFGTTANLTVQNVTIEDTINTSSLGGLEVYNVATATIQNVAMTAPAGAPSNGVGLFIGGSSSNVSATSITTSGHDGWAGVLLDPAGGAMSNITLQGSFAEVNKLQATYTSGGTITGLTANQFHFVARSTSPAYASGAKWFYKESETVALADALFNFEADGQNGGLSYVQPVQSSDEAQLQNAYVAGEIDGAANGYPGSTPSVRSSNIQTAIGVAASGATITVLSGTYDGPLTVNVAGMTITGAGGTSVLTSSSTPVLTASAANVTVTGVEVDSADAAHAGVHVTNVSGFAIHQSNLLTTIALQNAGSHAVDATQNYWGAADGPNGGGVSGSGGTILGTNVDASNFATSAY